MKERFRLPIQIVNDKIKINLKDNIISIGSCFAESIGEVLIENKFNIKLNPFGVIFNPINLFEKVNNSINNIKPNKDTYISRNGIYFNEAFHSKISSSNLQTLENNIIEELSSFKTFLQNTQILILTFGTSIVYRRKKTNNIVGNCHKLPESEFNKEVLTIDLILEFFEKMFYELYKINKSIKIILTVSPVRHIKDNLSQNSLSKSILRVVCYEIEKSYDNIQYFPSYEIMLDDLRDYRFYNEDMIHPNNIAIKYIWDLFKDSYFDDETKEFLKECINLRKKINHKPLNEKSNEYFLFLKNTLNEIQNTKYSSKFSLEKKEIETRLEQLSNFIKFE